MARARHLALMAGSSSTGLPSNVGGALSYLFGCFSGVFFLLVERRDAYVRFHAAQSTITFLAVVVISLVLGSVPGIGWLLSGVFSLMTFVLWAVLIFKAFTGERYKLPYVGEFADRQIR